MKNSILFITVVSVLFTTSSFNTSKRDSNLKYHSGIQFFEGSFREALLNAQNENKPLFIEVYATWCGPCKMLKRKTFKSKEVGDYFNPRFINIALDGESQEGLDFARRYGVRAYPTLLILDKNGNQLTRQEGFLTPHILVNFGKRIVP